MEDLLLHRPRRYEDRRHCRKIAEAKQGEPILFEARIHSVSLKHFRNRPLTLFEAHLRDENAEAICRWWNQPFREKQIKSGDRLLIFGTPNEIAPIILDHPEFTKAEHETIHLGRIVPIYRLTRGIPQQTLRELIWETLKNPIAELAELSPIETQMSRHDAFRNLHFPVSLKSADLSRRYFAEEELIAFQIKLQSRRKSLQKKIAPFCECNDRIVQPLLHSLSFHLTKSQIKVMREIRADMKRLTPMRRLLQGDVGSGKTIIAILTAAMMLESGFDVALMAPTELLANQHFETTKAWLSPLKIEPAILTASRQSALKQGNAILTIGTHALLESDYQPRRLGLVIIDEQHRFGVSQKNRLLRKGSFPHLLTMTATPIPRSLGLTVFGDLDHSILDELPANRGSVKTYLRNSEEMERIWDFIGGQIKKGRQAFVVYPRIAMDGSVDLKSIHSEMGRIQKRFPKIKIAALHGQLDRAQSDRIMRAFREKKIQILVATSMVEVGVDVPNATIMLIENAERFGLATLHQMRGRIGRGPAKSYCILTSPKDNPARERLQVLVENRDGFQIAEHDLQHRGPGQFLGQRQSGLPHFRFADLKEDAKLFANVRGRVRDHIGI